MEYRYTGDKTFLSKRGTKPLLLEPVRAVIALDTEQQFDVIPLDHDGRLTGLTVPVTRGSFVIDGAEYQTLYYVLERK
jgi:hypothetical protein